jgi:hypothetical protein
MRSLSQLVLRTEPVGCPSPAEAELLRAMRVDAVTLEQLAHVQRTMRLHAELRVV